MRIFVSSTCNNYEARRNAIYEVIATTGHTPLMTDSSSFPVKNDLHSHDVCLMTIEEADVFLLIIQSRYGHGYKGNKYRQYQNVSITHAEFKMAVELKKKIVVFGERNVFDERYLYKENPSSSIQSDIESFAMWDEATRLVKNNWIVIFDKDSDLIDAIKNKIILFSNFDRNKGAAFKTSLIDGYKNNLTDSINLLSTWQIFCDNFTDVTKVWTISLLNYSGHKVLFNKDLIVPLDKSNSDFRLTNYSFQINGKKSKGNLKVELKYIGNPIHSYALLITPDANLFLDLNEQLDLKIEFKHAGFFKNIDEGEFINYGIIYYLDYPLVKQLSKTQVTIREYFVAKELLHSVYAVKHIRFNPPPDWQRELPKYYVYGFGRSFSDKIEKTEIYCLLSSKN